MRHRWKRAVTALSAATALTTAIGLGMTSGAAVASGTSPAASRAGAPERIGTAPALPKRASRVGTLEASKHLQVTVTLQPRDPAGLAQLARDVSAPGNALYRHYLTHQQWVHDFAPSAVAVAAVRSQLRRDGLRSTVLGSDRLALSVSATAGQLAHAFGTSFATYRLASGRTAYANTKAPSFPASVARSIQGVIGLQNLYLPQREDMLKAKGGHRAPLTARGEATSASTTGPAACSAASSAGPSNDAYTINQIADAYGFASLYSAGDLGSGQTIALYELEPNLTSDISAYQSCFGTSATVKYVEVDGGAGTGAGEGEAALDIENVIGIAPKANVDVYQGPNSDSGAYDTYNSIVSQDVAKVISTSWGQCESSEGSSAASSENTLFETADTQGQGIFAAAGDSGSEDCGTDSLAVDDPASQPYVTGVGGTTITTLATPPSQTVWNDSSTETGAGGGGISTLWKMPTYQSGAPSSLKVINSNSSGTPCSASSGDCREVPDVSADADPYSGYVIYYDGSWTGIGGTSAAAPLWAGFTALTNASAACNGTNVGFANPALYKAAASGYSSDFDNITSGNNDYTGTNNGLYPAETGYSMAAGLGTPIGSSLSTALCGGSTTTGNTVTVTNPGSQSTATGTTVSLQIKASDSASGQTLTYTATNLPTGLSISSSGLISGKPTTAGSASVTVTATDTTGAKGSATFTWTITSSGGGGTCTATQLLGNSTFSTGTASPWTTTAGVIQPSSVYEPSYTGGYLAWLDGYGTPHTDTLAQTVTIPSTCTTDTFAFELHIDTSEYTNSAVDTLKVQAISGSTTTTLATYSNLNANNGYVLKSFSVSSFAGKSVTLKFTGVETDTGGGTTDFCIGKATLQD